jgi:hypothetical protein
MLPPLFGGYILPIKPPLEDIVLVKFTSFVKYVTLYIFNKFPVFSPNPLDAPIVSVVVGLTSSFKKHIY